MERAADDGSGDPRRLDAAKILKGGDASRRDDLDSPSQPSDPARPVHVRPGERAVACDVRVNDRAHALVPDAPGPDWLARNPGWLARFDALHVYSPIPILSRGLDLGMALRARAAAARAAGRPFMAPVAPGFDDRAVRQPGTVVPRDGGATYDRTWRAALAADPAWILVASWNEWHESSEIEPSREYGTRYLEATRTWAERFRAGGSPASPR